MDVNRYYTAPTATVAATPPTGQWASAVCPGLPQWSLVIVHQWDSHEAQDTWEALPQVSEHYPENMGAPAPAVVVTALAPWGVQTGMTMRQIYGIIRQQFPVWR